ncbi:MAG: RnfABCDGE type electron transport complex subunit D [Candidatus Cloacimonetes bacterium]|nr:RnfABCDGE type electron transport complex subunit D [Candidatus Cloacimonadota bacterium]
MKNLILKQAMMNKVLYSLIPIALFSVFLFGWRVLAIITITNFVAFITEWLFIRQKKNGKVSMAVFVTGSLLALSLPPTIPFWIAAIGAIFAVTFGKMVFGGFGMNIFNPAILGRTFVYISFPQAMTVSWLNPFTKFPGGFAFYQKASQLTSATPMIDFSHSQEMTPLNNLAIGTIAGSMGETSAILIILAGIYLILTKTAKWQVMLSVLVSFALFSFIFYGTNPLPLLLSGGLLFGSVFMITDPVSMPKDSTAIWIYGILVGFLTVIIRKYSLFVEGFMFAILLGNSLMPIIEYAIVKQKKMKKEKQ